jgi:hypothetical protein
MSDVFKGWDSGQDEIEDFPDWTEDQDPDDIDINNIPDLSSLYQELLTEGAFEDGDKTKLDSLLDWTQDQGATNIHSGNIPDLSGTYQPLDSWLTSISDLSDPDEDQILFWDDSAGSVEGLRIGTGLEIDGVNLNATGGGNMINVVDDYGADNTGTSRADEDIQDAMDAAADGDILYFPEGTYLINTTLNVPSGKTIHMLGGHAFGAELRWNGGSSDIILDMKQGDTGSIIDGFNFTNPGADSSITGIYAGNNSTPSSHAIKNCRFGSNLNTGIDGGSAMSTGGYALYDSEIKNCLFMGCTVGFKSCGSAVRIIGGKFYQCDYGLYMSTENTNNKPGNFCYGVVWTQCIYDIYVNTTNTMTNAFIGCWFEDSTGNILLATSGTRYFNRGFYFTNCLLNTADAGGDLININEVDSGSLSIIGCNIYDTSKDDILVPSGVTYTQLDLTGVSTGGTFKRYEDYLTSGVEAFTNASYSGTWATTSGGYAAVAYNKDPFGYVHIRGMASLASGFSSPSEIFELDTGYRPSSPLNFPVTVNGYACYVQINTDGDVDLYECGHSLGGTINYVTLSGITFFAG